MRPVQPYVFAVSMAAASAGGVQVAQVLGGRSVADALVAFLATWLVLALVLAGVVALLRRTRRAGRSGR